MKNFIFCAVLILTNKIPNITNFATTCALSVVENKIPDHGKYIITPKLTGENFAAKLAQTNLGSKNEFANFVKRTKKFK